MKIFFKIFFLFLLSLNLFSNENNIDIEDIIKILDDTIKEKLKVDALNTGIVCNRKIFQPLKTTALF